MLIVAAVTCKVWLSCRVPITLSPGASGLFLFFLLPFFFFPLVFFFSGTICYGFGGIPGYRVLRVTENSGTEAFVPGWHAMFAPLSAIEKTHGWSVFFKSIGFLLYGLAFFPQKGLPFCAVFADFMESGKRGVKEERRNTARRDGRGVCVCVRRGGGGKGGACMG